MKLIYKPFGIILGIVGGLLGKRLFDFVWTKIDDEEPPKATTQEAKWSKVIARGGAPGHDLQDHPRRRRPPGRPGLVLPHRCVAGREAARTRARRARRSRLRSAARSPAAGLQVGVSTSPPTRHSSARTAKPLIRSTRESRALAPSIAAWIARCSAGSPDSAATERVVEAVLGREVDRGVGVEHDERDDVGPAVADRDGVRDQRRVADELGLDVRRRHVLAPGADDQLLLAVDDRHVAVVVDVGDVAGVQPPSSSIAAAVAAGSSR